MDYTRQYKVEVQKVFAHVLLEEKKSTSHKQALQRAQKLVEKTQKDITSKPQSRKKERTEVVSDLNENNPDEDL